MCWNCGCMMPDNDMGNPANITTERLLNAARAGGNRNLKELVENMMKTYNREIKGKPVDVEPV